MSQEQFSKVAQYKDVPSFRARLRELGLDLPCDDRVLSAMEGSPLGQPLDIGDFKIGNRWCAHPMEGWDGTADGQPTDHTLRRWKHFGESGCKLIWGGEAFAVTDDGRGNPKQLAIVDDDIDRAGRGLELLLSTLVSAHKEKFAVTDDLYVGLQLTHSGRFCRPRDQSRLEPRIAYHHPLLDPKFGVRSDDDSVVMSDDDLRRLRDRYLRAAKLAQKVGFHFVDFKHCHGYFCHELLSGFTRPGPYGGSLENRTRFTREVIAAIQSECPGLTIGVRLSAFDSAAFKPDPARSSPGKHGVGVPDVPRECLPYLYGFGCNPNNPLEMDLKEPIAFITMLDRLGVRLINASCGSPYYNAHIQRPAMFPPSDGYQPPEDPLVGVARQIDAVRQIKIACPNSIFVGSGYTYLQEYLPHVAQGVIERDWADSIGIGRLLLSYWDLPADTLAGHPMQIKRICRTFSDCTSAPRNGIISGCFPLDPHYKDAPEHAELKLQKSELRKRLSTLQSS
jgi:2,4-dienoyl-CoA reductase-like NADH-dependent reductase (Old Yellow Enzyme family)